MTSKGMLFGAPMVRAILNGSKTQTRRKVKGEALAWLQPQMFTPEFVADPANHMAPHPAGSEVWVRETWSTDALGVYPCPDAWYRADFQYDDPTTVEHVKDCNRNQADCFACDADRNGKFKWRPSLFMPRKYSRITLKILAVRIERLHKISADDAFAEGCTFVRDGCYVFLGTAMDRAGLGAGSPEMAYASLWDEINGADSWNENPWVWVYDFKRVVE